MCGIVGIAFKQTSMDILKRMTASMQLRGPDAQGTWMSDDQTVALGHRRLSIIDLTESGSQPMSDPAQRWHLTFNGELYNYREMKAQLEEFHLSYRGSSDTEVLLMGLAHWGVEKTLQLADGMFAFAAWDSAEKKLYLARDRFGEKPLYYGCVNGAFVFASELKPLFKYPDFKPEIDPYALYTMLTFSYIPAPHSIYRDLHKLKPGHYLEVTRASKWELKTYWDLNRVVEEALEHPHKASEKETFEKAEQLLKRSVALRSVSDVPLGCFLSGGIDSSLITAMMCQSSASNVSTFSIGFEEARFNEADFARKTASHLGTDHTELILTESDARNVIPDLPHYFDEPFGDSSQIPTFLVSRLARRDVTVCLSGDAGDELFGGYTRYVHGPVQYSRFHKLPSFVRTAAGATLQSLSPAVWDRLYNTLSGMIPERYRVMHFGEKLQKLARAIRSAGRAEHFYQNLIVQTEKVDQLMNDHSTHFSLPETGWQQNQTLLTNMMVQDALGYLPGDILTKVDRASMAVSLESRVPFLEPKLFQFAWSLPLEYKIRQGKSKWILREVLAKYVPRALFERPKSGFAIPVAAWLRKPLKAWAEDLLPLDPRSHTLIRGDQVSKLWKEHQNGTRDHNAILWNILMFRAWEEHFHT
ncbi:MAG: asparagine synthase (glutamine-hydrolyzing) [Acidobacteria bacterium]|nr:MAG: asparagine synthase (glutamine-hydrolyzing) [Acidobacteriota bacterium]